MIKIINEAKVSDYIDLDSLHRIMHNPNFGEYDSYQQDQNLSMVVRTDKHDPAFPGADSLVQSRYWKFVKGNEGYWEVYEVDKYGKMINSKSFIVKE